jgi:putative phosphoesterase
MLVGILSDTHGRAEATAAGVKLLQSAGAASFVHCGDVGSEEVLDCLAGLPAAFVFGNTDWDREPLRRYAEIIGVRCLGSFDTLEFDGKRAAITHGDDGPLLRRLLDAQQHDYVFLGHSHIKGQQRVGKTLVINPGALHRASVKTVAVLDTTTDAVRWLDVVGF